MSSNLKKVVVIIGVVFIGWILILFLSIDALFQGFYGWAGFCGGILAFVILVASLLLWKPDSGRDTTEINAVPRVFTYMYFIVALLANTLFCFMSHLKAPKIIPLVVNVLLTVAFVTVRMSISPYRDHVLRTASYTAEKTRGVVGLSAKLGENMGVAQDKAVKQRLKELKEQLDYSANVSQPFTADLEAIFFSQLDDISRALERHAPTEDVLEKIAAAQLTWNRRNGVSTMN